jgi:hypothetical protein
MKRIIITALVTATLVGGGGAVAASLITSRQIADHTIRAWDMHKSSVNSRVVADGSLRLADLSPTARVGLKGDPGVDGADGVDGVDGADGVDGVDGADGVDGTDATALWAVVDDGAFHPVGDPVDEFHGSGIVSVTRSGADANGNAFYSLTFTQDIESCAVLATIRSTSGGPYTTIRAAAGDSVVQVRLSDNGGLHSGSFSVAVFC